MDWTSTLLPMATAFGMALLHSLWIGALLYCVVRTILPFLPGPGARHNLAYLALLGLGASFVVSLFYLYEPVVECSAEAVATNLFILGPAAPEAATPTESLLSSLQSYAPWLSAAYVLGLLPATLLLVRDQKRSWNLRHQDTLALPEAWRAQFRRELDRYPMLARVRCQISERAGEVMTLGWWSPVIVFPVALVNELTPEMARTILLHEIAHLRHYDHFLNYPQQLLRTLFFFHPAAHALCHIIDQEREHRCDDWVAARCDDRRTYATALVTVARSSIQPQNKLAMSATKTPFTSRIQRLFGGDHQKRDGQYALSVLMIVFLAAAQTGFAQLGADAGATDCPEEPAKVVADITDATAIADLSPVTITASATAKPVAPVAATLAAPETAADPVPDCCDDCPPQPPVSNDARAQEMYRRALNRYAQSRSNTAPVIINGSARMSKTLDCSSTSLAGIVSTNDELLTLATAPRLIGSTDAAISLSANPTIISGQRSRGLASSPVIINRASIGGTATVLPSLARTLSIGGIVDSLPEPTKITIKTKEEVKAKGAVRIKTSNMEGDNVAYFIDGKRLEEGEVADLDPDKIATVNVYKGEKLTELDLEGYDGAVMIVTKKGAKAVKGEVKKTRAVRINAGDLDKDNVVYFIDGERQKDGDITELSPEDIATVNVYKGDKLVELDLEGYDGAIMIVTKKGAKKVKKIEKKEN
ncbi:M56 family metallopeptidase [Lewinella sp. W8]|uniref:M56 family metallopeptidase n=1 Tax=Lewinella sp. W8 TaxID=2528208 RepID=UPI0010688949|nr:M56 family metallopeptidase [Lewinella sp. W8]MTB50127.1 hypothetical protein [Lewinella sp. W8]